MSRLLTWLVSSFYLFSDKALDNKLKYKKWPQLYGEGHKQSKGTSNIIISFRMFTDKRMNLANRDMASGVRTELENFVEPSGAFLGEDWKENQR